MLSIINTKLNNFPTSTVEKTATFYKKAFHSKIFTLFASSESEVYTFSKRHKPHYDFCFAFMENEEGQWYLDIDGIEGVRSWVVEQCKKNPDSIFELYKSWLIDWKKYHKLAEKLKKINFNELSDEDLYLELKRFYSQYLLVGSVAYIADSFMSTGTEDWLESLISQELAKIGIADNKIINLVRKLTSPVHLSFTLEAEYKLLKMACEIIKKHTEPLDFVSFKTKHPELLDELKEFENSFHWIQNNYYNVHYIDAKEFYEQIQEILEEKNYDAAKIKTNLEEKRLELEKIKSEREHLIETLGLSDFIRNLLSVARLFSEWKDVRKSGVYIGMYYFNKFIKEMSRRKNVPINDIYNLVFDELEDFFLRNKDVNNTITERKQQCFFAITPSGYFISGGEDADKYFKYLESEKNVNVAEIRGVVASPGYARGRVRIIRKTKEMEEFKTGEILVTNQTTPEFVPIIKKAAAIVTEQGGITSHAAVVSRELKKPCIIGTKIATSVLMDGEVVEVDANNGIVRRAR
ncbi:hypothetical protein HQ533_00945 [Candidatus Woesearchaeota archaeon]|nr:hypothetical protein [Candidatus Woesearchaeota archaeon]